MADNSNLQSERRTFLKATGAAAATAALAGVTNATPGREPGPKAGEWIVVTSATTSMTTAEADVQATIPRSASVTHRNETLGYLTVEDDTPGTADMDSPVVDDLESLAFVDTVERNATHYPMATPNDPKIGEQYAPQQVRAFDAYDTTTGSDDVTVAIVDQGVMYDHPDLQGRFGSNTGKDFVDDDSDPYPESMADEYHGTHVAGIASATTDNGTGVAGMSDSTLLSCRALGTRGGSTTDIADAVQYATDQGADVINMSLGGGGYADTMKNAVSYAVNNGALPICAAGNDGSSSVSYPAGYSECMAVSAVDSNENLADFSQYGDELDVAAPGVDVLSTWTQEVSEFGGKYNEISGTSMACPAASGVAALGLAAAGGSGALSPTELRARLQDTAVDIGLSEPKQGAGRVDALNIVEAAGGGGGGNTAPTVSINASSTTVTVGEAVEFDGSGSSDSDGSISSYSWEFGDGTAASGATATHTYESAGDYTVSLTVTDDDGATSTDSIAVTAESGDGGGGGSCGDVRETASADGSLAGYWDGNSYTYTAATSNPCQVSFVLDGPSSADFDLYVTYDGRTPTTADYDQRAASYGADETLSVDDVSTGQEFGVLVDAYDGSGSYTLTVEELGK